LAACLVGLGEAVLACGDVKQAEQHIIDALRLATEIDAIPIVLRAMIIYSRILYSKGKSMEAATLAFFVLSHETSEENSKADARRAINSIRSEMSDEEIKALEIKAETLTLQQIASGITSDSD